MKYLVIPIRKSQGGSTQFGTRTECDTSQQVETCIFNSIAPTIDNDALGFIVVSSDGSMSRYDKYGKKALVLTTSGTVFRPIEG